MTRIQPFVFMFTFCLLTNAFSENEEEAPLGNYQAGIFLEEIGLAVSFQFAFGFLTTLWALDRFGNSTLKYKNASITAAGIAAGAIAGSTAVWMIGRANDQNGSYLASLAGSTVGVAVSMIPCLTNKYNVCVSLSLVFCPAGGFLGYNFNRIAKSNSNR